MSEKESYTGCGTDQPRDGNATHSSMEILRGVSAPVDSSRKDPNRMSIQELQQEISRLQTILVRKVVGDPTQAVGLQINQSQQKP